MSEIDGGVVRVMIMVVMFWFAAILIIMTARLVRLWLFWRAVRRASRETWGDDQGA